ncbi:HEPN domain-containing protein [Fulvivirga sp. M361]|uniref:HEPN domain-containing protein n=1 Tax=Fulvivirga sp. M361 TaxID=2594266 RepID=UPI00117B215D|nr:HEPN domain-containing protein [Fulvivirga sp. M361]TRX54799.1 HEPN domain-containing protein [Fulvivirga sp. M361]
MNEALQKLPLTKQEELQNITKLLSSMKKVEMVILFGSYARGEYVEDTYVEKGILYEYKSDYDLLVVTLHDDLKCHLKIETKVNEVLRDTGIVKTPVSLIFHSGKHLNQSLMQGNYFFKDIKKEGIVLYDTGKVHLQNPKKLTAEEAREKAQGYFDQWFTGANEFLEGYKFYLSRKSYHLAAFQLHQATERYYTTILLVYTDYRPKEHDLERLDLRVKNCDPRFAVFPYSTDEEKQLFELLRKAYVDARYKMDEYSISKVELDYLAEKVERLKGLTERLCKEKIEGIGRGKV